MVDGGGRSAVLKRQVSASFRFGNFISDRRGAEILERSQTFERGTVGVRGVGRGMVGRRFIVIVGSMLVDRLSNVQHDLGVEVAMLHVQSFGVRIRVVRNIGHGSTT